jgi:proline iminopeptidase
MQMEGHTSSGLYYKTLGQGPLVVVLHGGPGADHQYLLPQLGELAKDFTLLFYDQRGAGQSRTGNPVPGWLDHARDLESLRSELALGPMRLLGYSWGGLLALLYALEHLPGVERLALCSPAAPVATYRVEMRETMRERMRQAEALGMSGFARAVAGYFANPHRALELTQFRVQARAEESVWRSLGDYDLRPRLGEIQRPALVIHGAKDPIPIRYSEELARLLPSARWVPLDSCGHVPFVECPLPFFAALRDFLSTPVAPT